MRERPIIFNGEMVRAILDGRKTQTRRVMKEQPEKIPAEFEHGEPGYWVSCHAARQMVRNSLMTAACPFGFVGDRLWVRETFACIGNEDGHPIDANGNLCDRESAKRIYKADCFQKSNNYGLWSSPDGFDFEGGWTPSIHMPRWASRITLEITGVRVERLNDISYDDAIAEGVKQEWTCIDPGLGSYAHKNDVQEDYAALWKFIYGAESWNANPWVWIVEFRRVTDERQRR